MLYIFAYAHTMNMSTSKTYLKPPAAFCRPLRSNLSVEEVSLVYRRMCLRGHPSRGGVALWLVVGWRHQPWNNDGIGATINNPFDNPKCSENLRLVVSEL